MVVKNAIDRIGKLVLRIRSLEQFLGQTESKIRQKIENNPTPDCPPDLQRLTALKLATQAKIRKSLRQVIKEQDRLIEKKG